MLSTLLAAIALIILLLVAIFFVTLLVMSIIGFVKGNKSIGYFFLIIFVFLILFSGYFLLIKDNPKNNNTKIWFTSNEAKERLRTEKISLDDSVSVMSHQYENDLYFYRLQFSVKISNSDYEKLSKGKVKKDYIFQDFTKEGQQIHDTLKINLTKDNILHFYKCRYDTNN